MEVLRKEWSWGTPAVSTIAGSTGGASPATVGDPIAVANEHAKELRRDRAIRTDEMLFERIARERSEDAFSELYDRYSPRVYSLLIHMLRTEEDAQDLLQEVFIIIWNKAPLFIEQRGNVAGWIVSLARNRAVDVMRSKLHKAKKREESLVLSDDRPDIEALLENNVTPETELAAKEAQTEVARALKSLSMEQRNVVDLAYFGGLSHSEIAERLNMPMGSVKSKMRQAVIKMAKVLKPRF